MIPNILKDIAHRVAPGWADRAQLAHRARKMTRAASSRPSPAEWLDVLNKFDDFRTYQIRDEILALMDLVAGLRPSRACEIGTAAGGTLFLLARACRPDARILSLDWEYSPAQLRAFPEFAAPGQALKCLAGDSHTAASRDRASAFFGGEEIDYLFIDGDHSYDGVKADFEMYSPLVRAGGLIAFHDINPDHRSLKGEQYEYLAATHGVPRDDGAISGDVPRFWSEIRGRHGEYREIVAAPNRLDQDGAGIGVLFWPGP